MNHPLADNELKTASFEAGDFKNLHPESRLIYVTHKDRQDIQMQDQNDAILVTNSLDPAVSGKMIADKLKTIPSHLVVYVENDFEDYITPSVATMYEIHRKYFQKGDVRLKVRTTTYTWEFAATLCSEWFADYEPRVRANKRVHIREDRKRRAVQIVGA